MAKRKMLSKQSERQSWERCKPRVFFHQPFSLSYGEEVYEFAKLCGYELSDWQKEAIEVWSAYKVGKNGKREFVHQEIGASIPRQTGKSVDAIVWASFLACVLGYKVLWTDHNYSTTCEMLERFKAIFGKKANDVAARSKVCNSQVASVSLKTSQEFIKFHSGGLIAFSTRTKTATLGFSFDVVIFDEAQEATTEHMSAIMPTATSGAMQDPQYIYTGTPTPAGSLADVFQTMRAQALDEKADDMAWIEYGIEDCKEDEEGDEELWYKANPSLGLHANIKAIRASYNLLKPIGAQGVLAFKQQYLGYWLPKVSSALVSEQEWAKCCIEPKDTPKTGKRAFGVKFSADGSCVALAGAIKEEDKPVHVEVIDVAPTSRGTTWLAEWLLERTEKASCVAIDGMSGVGALLERISDKAPKGYILIPKASDVMAAASMTLDSIQERRITHIESASLDTSVLTAIKRPIGKNGGWGWGGDSAPIEAASLALWAVHTTVRDPRRKQVIL